MPAILIIKTSSLGDVIHNLPIVRDIHARVPDARLDWLVEQAYADIPALHPGVRRVIPVALRRWRRAPWRPAVWSAARTFLRTLRSERYDLVLDSQGLLKSAVLGACARGPVAGQDRDSVRERIATVFYQRHYPVARGQHAVTRNRALAALACGYAVPADAPDYGIAPAPSSPTTDRYAVLLHATSRASKRWPDDHWVAIGEELRRLGFAAWLPSGTDAERAHAQRLAARIPRARTLEPLTLRTLAGIIAGATLVIGVDTGLVHLAGALGRPTIALYTDSDPTLTGVLPADPARAINLGGRGRTPTPDDVRAAMQRLGVR